MHNKAIKIGIGVAVVILVAVAALAFLYKDPNIITEKDPGLTAEERKIYEDRLAGLDTELAQAGDDTQKYHALIQQGFQLYGLGKFEQAKAKYEEALKVKGDEYSGYTALFEVEVAMNDLKAARESIKRAIELNKTSADTWKRYALFESDIMKAEASVINGIYIDALRETVGHVDIMTSFAVWLEKSGNLQAAKEYWQKAAVANSANKAAYDGEVARIDALISRQQ